MGKILLPESAVLAYGGNALKEKGDGGNIIEAQERAMQKAAESIAAVRALAKKVLVVHGNGPQVGWMVRRSEIAAQAPYNMHTVHLRNVVASSQGAIGTSMAKQVANVDPSLRGRVVEVGTQVQVDENDPAFGNPSKPIGDFMDQARSDSMVREYGWVVQERDDGPKGRPFRRVVASPEPRAIAEIDAIKLLVGSEFVTICVGGGGVPFILEQDGTIVWVDAVIDKDAAAALAAILFEIKFLAIFTAEDGIYDPSDFNKRQRGDKSVKPMQVVTVAELAQMGRALPSGSMGPKAASLCKYTETTQNKSWVGPLDGGLEALTEGRGTTVVPS